MTQGPFSLWLLAAESDARVFSTEITRLALRHGTPLFQPHLTLLGNIAEFDTSPAEIIQAVAGAADAFTLPIADVQTGTTYYRSFYAAFTLVPQLERLRTMACRLCNVPPDGFMPHVSLLYGVVGESEKAESAAETRLRLKNRAVRFDRMALTNSADNVPISDWRCLAIVPLRAVR